MLTEQEKNEILEEVKQYPYAAAACIDALRIVQDHRGWVADESIKDIARMLDMSDEDVDGVATFYSRIYRRPVGRNVILICDGISCMIMKYGTIYDYVSKKLGIGFGENTTDGRFTLLPISCLGDCDHALVMMINNHHYNNLTVDKIDELLSNYE